MKAYKAFDENLRCLGFQFEVGGSFEHDGEVRVCRSGFHACENPLDVWNYYPLDSRYAVVELGGEILRHGADSKVAAGRITIRAEITLPQLINDGVAYLTGLCKTAASGKCSQLAASGDGSQLAASGKRSQLAASGDYSKLAASGDGSKLAASGYGSQLAAFGNDSVCMAASHGSTARAGAGGAIALTYHDGVRYRIAVAYVGEDGIEPNVNYYVTADGVFAKANER